MSIANSTIIQWNQSQIMDNASIDHIDEVASLIETEGGARLIFLPPYSPDLNPAEGAFSQVKSLMKENDNLFQACTAPRALLAMIDYH